MADYRNTPIHMTLGRGRSRIRLVDDAGQIEEVGFRYRGARRQGIGDGRSVVYDPGGNNAVVVKDGRHNAFPSVVKLPDGTLLVVYRAASDHVSSDGVIELRRSSDLGRTWSAPEVVYQSATQDARDPSLRRLSDGRLMMTFFVIEGGMAIPDSVRVTWSADEGATWTAPVVVDSTFTSFCAISDGVLELAGGTLLIPVYGRNTADSVESCRVLRSTDGGSTWTNEVTVGNGPLDSRRYQEPALVLLPSGTVRILMRSDTDDTQWTATSADGGLTWTAPSLAFSGTGSAHLLLLSGGQLLASFRANGTNKPIGIRLSNDDGATWSGNQTLENTGGDFSVYSEAVEIGPGMIALVYAYQLGAVADIYLTYLSTVRGTTPLGDEAMGAVAVDSLRVLGSAPDTVIGHPIATRFSGDLNRRNLIVVPRDDAPADTSSRLILGGIPDLPDKELGAVLFGRKGQAVPSAVITAARGSAATYGDLRFDVRGPSGYLRGLWLTEGGAALIGTATQNPDNTRGLTIQQGAGDNEILSLKSTDVAHGMTDLAQTDTFALLRKQSAATGGLMLRTLSSTGRALDVDAFGTADDTAKTAAARGYITINAGKKNLSGAGAAGAGANLLVIGNYFSTRFIFEGSGDLYFPAAGKGIVLVSPDGAQRKRLSIDNTGALVLTTV